MAVRLQQVVCGCNQAQHGAYSMHMLPLVASEQPAVCDQCKCKARSYMAGTPPSRRQCWLGGGPVLAVLVYRSSDQPACWAKSDRMKAPWAAGQPRTALATGVWHGLRPALACRPPARVSRCLGTIQASQRSLAHSLPAQPRPARIGGRPRRQAAQAGQSAGCEPSSTKGFVCLD